MTLICAHCMRPPLGLAGNNDGPLCHPDYGLDCYSLVTVCQHSTPCTDCRQIRDEQDHHRNWGHWPEDVSA